MATPPGPNATIYFGTHHQTHYEFNNISGHPIRYQNRLYKTADNLYHALKFLGHEPELAEYLREASDPHRFANIHDDRKRADWPTVHLQMMEQVLILKFHQYPGLKSNLDATGDARLIQLGTDQYWSQNNGNGRNEFGNTLMRVRSTLRR